MYSTISNFAYPKKTIQKILSIDSIFRENPEQTLSTCFSYILPDPISNITSISVKSIEIPDSIYDISEINDSNIFTIENGINSYTISVDSGNYNEESMLEYLNYYFQNITDLSMITYEIDPYSRKSGFTTTASDISFQFIFSREESINYDQTFGGFLGFRSDFPYILTNKSSIISESPFGTSSQKYYFLNIIDYTDTTVHNKEEIYINPYDFCNNKYIMARIPIKNQEKTVFINRYYYGIRTTIECLKISLVDKYGKIIDLNSNDFSFVLEFNIEV